MMPEWVVWNTIWASTDAHGWGAYLAVHEGRFVVLSEPSRPHLGPGKAQPG